MTAQPKPEKAEKPWTPNDRERLFIHEMIDPRMKGAEAARRAGYAEKSSHVAASRLLSNDNIRALIDEERRKFWSAKAMSVEELVAEVSNLARFSMGRIVHVTKDGDPFIDLSMADEDDMKALAEVSVEDFTVGRGDDAREVRRVKAKPFNKLQALDLMAKIRGILKPVDVNVNLTSDFAQVMADAERRAADLAKQRSG